MAKLTSKSNLQVMEEASAWFVDFNEEEVDRAGLEQFNAWLRRSPEHVRAFLQVSALWEDAGALRRRADLDIDGLIARAQDEHNVLYLESAVRGQGPHAELSPKHEPAVLRHERSWLQPRTKRLWLASAASVVLALGIGALTWYLAVSAETYAAGIGEQRSITLQDGSSIELNSRSRVRVRFTDARRFVDLLEGQALFAVAKDPTRPFIVAAGGMQVRAVGTRFDVYRKSGATVVTVVEGRVAIASHLPPPIAAPLAAEPEGEAAPARQAPSHGGSEPRVGAGEVLLKAGEQLRISPAAIEFSKDVHVAAATAWTEKRLIFDDTPLREAVEEFNRYNRRQLVIRDPDLYDFHISGVFPSTDPARMVEFLRQRFGVTMSRTGDEIEITRQRDPTSDSI